MSEKSPRISQRPEGPSWGAAAFLIESMLLLVFLAVAMALFFQLFGLSLVRAHDGEDLSRAVAAASSTAERFASDPSSAEGSFEVDGMRVDCDVSERAMGDGVLYTASIEVFATDGSHAPSDAAEPCYSLSATRYESGVTR